MEDIKNFIVNQENTYKMPMETLQALVRSGKAKEIFHVHDKLVLTFDGEEELHEIIGIDAEELVDKNLKYSITVQSVRLIGEAIPFDEDGCNNWSECNLRKYINDEEFMSRYEEDMEQYTALVVKKNTPWEDTQDRFFVLSKDEVCGGYPAFKTERDRIKTDLDGETDWHRLRSAFRGNAGYTWFVNASGYVSNVSASYALRFAPAWVVA